MKLIWLLLLALLVVANIHAEERRLTPADSTQVPEPSLGKAQEPVKKSNRKSTRSFKPKEQISADSAVSFPVDI